MGASLAIPQPAFATGTGRLFDFDATLPIMIIQMLLLTLLLDKLWFGPVARYMEARDNWLKGKIASAEEMETQTAKLEEEAEVSLRNAKREAEELISKARAELEEEHQKQIKAAREVRR